MPIQNIILVYAILSGMMSIVLMVFTIFFEKDKKRSRTLLIWAALFLASSFAVTEYAFWMEGYNLFTFVLLFNFPLVVFFATWFTFLIWLFESRSERKVWMLLLALLIVTVIVAMNCMNCLNF